MKNYFENCVTPEEIKKMYLTLSKKFHPDLGGSTESMKNLNNQYDEITKNHNDFDFSIDIKPIIKKLVTFDNITIEICGSWLWVSGSTFEIKEDLKKLGLKWSPKKKAWYLAGSRSYNKKSYTMEDIRSMHGSKMIKTQKILV